MSDDEALGETKFSNIKPVDGAIATSIPGALTEQIGSEEHAQNSIVYRTISWSFAGGALLSVVSVGVAIWQKDTHPLNSLKDVWSIFTPLITLALGYLFGKGR